MSCHWLFVDVPRKITSSWLRQNNASEDVIDAIESEFPTGMDLSAESLKRASPEFCDWLVHHFSKDPLYSEYKEFSDSLKRYWIESIRVRTRIALEEQRQIEEQASQDKTDHDDAMRNFRKKWDAIHEADLAIFEQALHGWVVSRIALEERLGHPFSMVARVRSTR